MNIYLCLLGPSLISIKIFNHLNSERLSNKNIIFYYVLFVFINNFICTFFSVIFFGGKSSIDESLINFPVFAIKYVIVSVIFSCIIPFFVEIVRKNIDYNIEVKKNEKYKSKIKNKKSV